MSIQKLILEKLEKIDDQTVKTRIDVATIKEHLSALNGRVEENEQGVKDIKETDLPKVRKSVSKLAVKISGIAGIVTLIITLIIQKL